MSANRQAPTWTRNPAALLAAVPDVMLVLDQMARVDFASMGSAGFLGARPRDWVGRSLLDHVHPQDVDCLVERLAMARRGIASSQALPLRIAMEDGSWRRVAAHGFATVEAKEMLGTFVMLGDATGQLGREVARKAGLDTVFDHRPSDSSIASSGRRWIVDQLLPLSLDDTASSGSIVGVVVMTLTDTPGLSSHVSSPAIDNPIAALAQRVSETVRPSDMMARLDDTQLVILCTGLSDSRTGLAVARRLHQWCCPNPHGDASIPSLGLSTGVAFASHGDDAGDVLDFAASAESQFECGRFLLTAS